ncbi:MAG: pentapeptide repeat-containing protein [Gammaproteobacteria bacterium]|nr:pentapeptide repeat-containing protein [Gammaproteobacteria bacterium]
MTYAILRGVDLRSANLTDADLQGDKTPAGTAGALPITPV